MDIITVGHIVYDIRAYVEHLPEPDVRGLMREPFHVGGGGSAANVAVNCSRLGKRAGVIGNLGKDHHGRFLWDNLWAEGVDTREVRLFDGRTALSIITIDRKGEVEVTQDLGVAERDRAIDPSYISETRHLHLAGTSLEMLLRAASIGSKKGVSISFDPGRAAAFHGEKKLSPILRATDYLLVNRKELKYITGSDSDHAAKHLASKYDLAIVIKSGSAPIVTFGVEEVSAPPFKVKAIDTIGAGDAFCAGFLCSILDSKNLTQAVRFANAAGAAKVLHRGAQGMPKKQWIEKTFGV
jgi:ribokinase